MMTDFFWITVQKLYPTVSRLTGKMNKDKGLVQRKPLTSCKDGVRKQGDKGEPGEGDTLFQHRAPVTLLCPGPLC